MMAFQSRSFIKRKKQIGTFVVEFAVMATALAMVLAFCGDTVIRLSTKGKLDRLAYSAVTIIKERGALFEGVDFQTTNTAQFESLTDIVQNSLDRTLGSFSADRFGMALEVQTFNADGDPLTLITQQNSQDEGIECVPTTALDGSLSVVSSQGQQVSLYRVTVCYQTVNWFGALVGRDYGIVSSNAVSVGR
ncbi:tight adherence pilus pseudopilin TadF [Marinomonas atlantica]|uniref:tight adherence pilus pseudopilin TadF n=1 Tax=Marinomonas atlantica TaxID=1806668 RepID=UPI0009EE4B84|nr:tight adherence pilus pseudopilin TadF [Marinomonas atlantica]MCO4784962.1 hypothetical protein [Marinomonas atlantica]